MTILAREQYNEFIQSLAVATRLMNLEIKKTIEKKKVFDTTYMKNTTIVKIKLAPENKKPLTVEIDTTEYYKYMDGGTGIFGRFKTRIPDESINGMAYYLRDWAERKGLNPYAVATSIVQRGGLKPREITKEFVNSKKFRSEMNRVTGAWARWQSIERIRQRK